MSDLIRYLYPRHLLDHFLEDQQVKTGVGEGNGRENTEGRGEKEREETGEEEGGEREGTEEIGKRGKGKGGGRLRLKE